MRRVKVKKTWRVDELETPIRIHDDTMTHVAILGESIHSGLVVYGKSENDADHSMWTMQVIHRLRPFKVGQHVALLSVKRGTVRVAGVLGTMVIRGRVFYRVIVNYKKKPHVEVRTHDELFPTINSAVVNAFAKYQLEIDNIRANDGAVRSRRSTRTSNKLYSLLRQSMSITTEIEKGGYDDAAYGLLGNFKIIPGGHPALRASSPVQIVGKEG
jgi:hypothetical protein